MNKQQIQQAFNTFRNRIKAERGPNPDFSHFEAFKAGIEVAQLAAAAPAAASFADTIEREKITLSWEPMKSEWRAGRIVGGEFKWGKFAATPIEAVTSAMSRK